MKNLISYTEIQKALNEILEDKLEKFKKDLYKRTTSEGEILFDQTATSSEVANHISVLVLTYLDKSGISFKDKAVSKEHGFLYETNNVEDESKRLRQSRFAKFRT